MGQYAQNLARKRAQTRLGIIPDRPLPTGATRPNPLKGKRDGVCNRTACQRSLIGREQWTMRNYMVPSDPLHYCGVCAHDFNAWDRKIGDEIRCTIVPETEGQFR